MPPVSVPPPAPVVAVRQRRGLLRWWAPRVAILAMTAVATLSFDRLTPRSGSLGRTGAEASDSLTAVDAGGPNEREAARGDESACAPSDGEQGAIPRETITRSYGPVWLIDLGVTSLRLQDSLRIQRTLARRNRERLMLMVSRGAQGRGDAFVSLLGKISLQSRVGPLRIVRVDIGAFEQELALLRVPMQVAPAFFLLDEHSIPRDGIHYREWTDPEDGVEVGTVLARFLAGRYTRRRYEWAPISGSLRL